MPILQSVIAEDATQADARRAITEAHTDQVGVVRLVKYLALSGADVSAAMLARVPALNAALIADEIAANILAIRTFGSLATLSLVHSTASANATALRAAYKGMMQVEAIWTGDFLNAQTDAALQSAFGVSAGVVASIRASTLAPAAATAATIRAAAGV